jgi:hypothetical protein
MKNQQKAEYILYHIFCIYLELNEKSDHLKTLEQIKTLVESYLLEVERDKKRKENNSPH